MSIYRSDTSKIITINSLNRISGSSTDFSIAVNNLPKLMYNRVVLNQISIPRSWYDIGDNYNTFFRWEGSSNKFIIYNTWCLYFSNISNSFNYVVKQ